MKIKLYALLLLIFFTATAFTASSQAHVQFVHDSPDTTLTSADIYINGTKYFSIWFCKATPFTTLPAGQLSIGIAHAGSSSANDTIKNLNITLQADSSYYIVLSGLIDTAGFEHNPQGAPINFAINVFTHASLTSGNILYDCNMEFFNGSTDAGPLNLRDREQRKMLFKLIGYPQFGTGYKDEVTSQPVILDLTDTTGTKVLSTYLINLSGYSQQSVLVFSSGYINPPQNGKGAGFGLFAVFENGDVVQLADTAIASLQLIHNAADTNAVALDIYMNDILWMSDVYFRTATPYLYVPAGMPLRIGIAIGNSSSYTQVFDSFTVSFENAESYIGFLDGVLDTSGFEANPNGKNIALNLFNLPYRRQVALDTSKVDIFFFNGSTDEGGIDIIRADSSIMLANNIEYGDTSPYSELMTKLYQFNLTPGNNVTDILASYQAYLNVYAGQTMAVFTSGFVDSTMNNSGPSLGLFAATSYGNVIQFPLIEAVAEVQFIHNSTEPKLSSASIYINGNQVINNLNFRHATPFSFVPAGITMNIGIAHAGSTSVIDTLKNIPITLVPNSTNILMLEGLIDTSGFAANPNGRNTGFNIRVIDSIHTKATQSNMVDIRMVQGSTDEPASDFILDKTLPPLFDDMSYGDVDSYALITPAMHSLFISPHNDDTFFTRQYDYQFSPFTGTSLTVFSSGFIYPSANQNGPPFWVWFADTLGNTYPLTDISSISNINSINYINIYPNPTSDYIVISNKENEEIHLQLMDMNGREVTDLGYMENNSYHIFSLSGIADGMYLIRVRSNSIGVQEMKLIIQR